MERGGWGEGVKERGWEGERGREREREYICIVCCTSSLFIVHQATLMDSDSNPLMELCGWVPCTLWLLLISQLSNIPPKVYMCICT